MRTKILNLGLLIIIFLTACKPPVDVNAPPLPNTVAEAVAATLAANQTALPKVSTMNQPTVINPLTGLPAADPALLERRPVMVKVSNYPQTGRPHAGLSFADMVFDYFIGSGTNRFLALFYGQDSPVIGPVRSGRRVDAQLVTMYNGVLGYGSADEDTDAELITDPGRLCHFQSRSTLPGFLRQVNP